MGLAHGTCENGPGLRFHGAVVLSRLGGEQQALTSHVREEYRLAIFNHIVEGREYKELEQEYGISISTMKRWTQRFVYGVATELGENYFK